jgi:16S rRNA (uracil1498-N3)-methyltransferase
LIGPEGDFTPHEVARLAEAGVLPVGLGPNRLRTETAAIAALAAAVLASDAAA